MPTSEPQPPPVLPDNASAEGSVARWQFSLKALFRFTTIFALLLGFSVVMPSSLSMLLTGAIWLAISGGLVTGLIFARGDQRAFCIGAAIVVSSLWTGIGGRFMQGVHWIYGSSGFPGQIVPGQLFTVSIGMSAWLDLAVIGVTAILNGIFCVYARRFFQQTDG